MTIDLMTHRPTDPMTIDLMTTDLLLPPLVVTFFGFISIKKTAEKATLHLLCYQIQTSGTS